jgi:ABC-type dipeptide/oligopeptide/nickel transport system permease subunit
MSALPLFSSGAATALAYIVLAVVLAAVAGAVVGLLANRAERTRDEQVSQPTDSRRHLGKAA